MDLKKNKITVGELLEDPRSRGVLQKRFPTVLKHPLVGSARTVTLEQLLSFAQAYMPQNKISATLEELRKA